MRSLLKKQDFLLLKQVDKISEICNIERRQKIIIKLNKYSDEKRIF